MPYIAELNDNQLDQIAHAIMQVAGVTKEHESDLLIEEMGEGVTGIKFMSDRGVTDDANGIAFATYLMSHGCVIEPFMEPNHLRGMVVDNDSLVRLFSTYAGQE